MTDASDSSDEPQPGGPRRAAPRRWGYVAITAAVGFIALLAFGLVAKGGPSIAVGEEAPVASVDRLGDEGEGSIADHSGEWVLLNFWASWCEPCRDEAPAIERFSRENRGEVVVVGMDSRDLSPDALGFAEQYGLTYELLHDGDGEVMDSYNVKGLPESFLIDPDGNIAYIYRGPVDERVLAENFQPLIEGST